MRTPRDRAGTFEPQLVRKRQTRLAGLDDRVLDLYAGGMSVRDIAAHLEGLYGAEVGRDADFVFMDRAQHSPAAGLLESVALGDIPGVGMVMIDGLVRCGRSRNTPPATEVPVVVAAAH